MLKKVVSVSIMLSLPILGIVFAGSGLDDLGSHVIHNTDEGTITVYSNDFSYGITLQDRNLGAENIGDDGDYYQFGNNQPWDSSDPDIVSSWADYQVSENRLQWGHGDFIGSDENIHHGYDKVKHQATQLEERRGPCDAGYHVPSAGEWEELIKLWCDQQEGCGLMNDLHIYDKPNGDLFTEEMKFVGAGYLVNKDYDETYTAGSIFDRNEFGNYRSSSFKNTDMKPLRTTMAFGENDSGDGGRVNPQGYIDGNWGQSVRCFKDQYESYENTLVLQISGADDHYIKFPYGETPSASDIYQAITQIGEEVNLPIGSHIEWYTYNDLNEKVPFELKSENVTSNLVLVGEIETNTYSIRFVDEHGNEIMTGLNITYSDTEQTQFDIYQGKREGYIFRGWKASNGTVYPNGAQVTNNLTGTHNAVINLVTYREKVIQGKGNSGGGGKVVIENENTAIKKVIEKDDTNILDDDQLDDEENRNNSTNYENLIKKVSSKELTRGEIAVMTNMLLDVYPEIIENKKEINEACSEYTDEKEFSDQEKKAITRLCRYAIMGIHGENQLPLDEFMVEQLATNDEFAKVINRSITNYDDESIAIIKTALNKIEGDNENVVFGTVYDIFMTIKSLFKK